MISIKTKEDCYLYYTQNLRPLISEMEALNNADYSQFHNDMASLFDLIAVEKDPLSDGRIQSVLLKVQLASLKMVIQGYNATVKNFDARVHPSDLRFINNGLFIADYQACKDEILRCKEDVLSKQEGKVGNREQMDVLDTQVVLLEDLLEPYIKLAEAFRKIYELIHTYVPGYAWSEKKKHIVLSKRLGLIIQFIVSVILTILVIVYKPVDKIKQYMEHSNEPVNTLIKK